MIAKAKLKQYIKNLKKSSKFVVQKSICKFEYSKQIRNQNGNNTRNYRKTDFEIKGRL
jgi:hypothetical protein